MDLISLIKNLFVLNLIEEVILEGGSYKITMKEKNKNSKLSKVDIRGLPANSIALKLDKIDPNILKKFLLGKKGEVTRCDYVLFVQESNNNYMYFIELKSKYPKYQKVENQLKSSYCLIKYCSMLAENFHNTDVLNNFEDRYIVIKRQNMNKRPTEIRNNNWSKNSPFNYATINLSTKDSYIPYQNIR